MAALNCLCSFCHEAANVDVLSNMSALPAEGHWRSPCVLAVVQGSSTAHWRFAFTVLLDNVGVFDNTYIPDFIAE
jgi:hypothetical protein